MLYILLVRIKVKFEFLRFEMAEWYTVDEVVSFLSGERVLPDYSSSSGSDVERNAECSLHHATTRNLPGTSNEAGTSAPKRQRLQEYSSEDENTYSEMKVSLKKMLAVIQFLISSLLVVPLQVRVMKNPPVLISAAFQILPRILSWMQNLPLQQIVMEA